MNKIQLQELVNKGTFTKEEISKITSVEEIAAILDSGASHLKQEKISTVVKACFNEIYKDNEYDPVYEQTTLNTYFLFHILDIDEIVLASLLKLLDGSAVKFIFWSRNFLENTTEEIKQSYNFFLEMFKNYRDYQNDFTQVIKYVNNISEMTENKEFLENFVKEMSAFKESQ